MQLRTLKNYFKDELLGYFPEDEILSFFFMLVKHYLQMERIDVALRPEQELDPKKYDAFHEAIQRLKAYEPIQYILGETEFYGLKLNVNKAVLIPRPETEELVDWMIKDLGSFEGTKVLDVGTGSGCIAISLAKHLRQTDVYALDLSGKALQLAGTNANLNDTKVNFIETNILDQTNWNKQLEDIKFDVIVSNPPYVRQQEKAQMAPNVLNYEPHTALFVEDDDALLFYKTIIHFSEHFLKPKGRLYFEINEYLGKAVVGLLEAANFKSVELKQDTFGKDRMVKAIKYE